MAGPVKNTEIEDVLSSIRRLVSEGDRLKPVGPEPMPERLVLTPALRVDAEPGGEETPDAPVAEDTSMVHEAPEAQEAPAAPETPMAPDAAPRVEESSPPEAETGRVDDAEITAAPNVPSPQSQPTTPLTLMVEQEVSRALSDAISAETEKARPNKTSPVDGAVDADPDAPAAQRDSHEESWYGPSEAPEDVAAADRDAPGITSGPDDMSALPETPEPPDMPLPDLHEDDPAEHPEPAAIGMSDVFVLRRAGGTDDGVAAATGTGPDEESAPHDTVPVDTAAHLADAARSSSQGAQASDNAPLADDPSAPLAEDADGEDRDRGLAQAHPPADAAAQDWFTPVSPTIDEDLLRDMVAEIVRQELQGALGERITRNVRKLVRREIHRVLMSQDFD